MSFVEDRSRLLDWAEGKGPDGLTEYRAEKNARSIDGLPGSPRRRLDPGASATPAD